MVQYIKDELRLEWKEYFAVVFGVQLGAWLITEAVVRLLLHEPVMAGAARPRARVCSSCSSWRSASARCTSTCRSAWAARGATRFSRCLCRSFCWACAPCCSAACCRGCPRASACWSTQARRGLNVGQIILGDYAAVCAAGLVCCVAFGVLAGTLVQRFGRAAFWVLYAVMIVAMLLAEHLMRLFAPDTGALGFVTRALMPLGAAGPAVLLAAGALVFALAGWLVLRRTSVRV